MPYPIDRFLNVRSASSPAFSPDGRSVAFLTNVTGLAQAWQVPAEGGWPVQVTFASDSVRSVGYHPRLHRLVYSTDAGGNERNQLYLVKGTGDHGLGDGWDAEPLAVDPKAIHHFGGFSHDGDRFAFSANRSEPSRFDVYVQKFADKTPTLLARGPGGYYRALGWSPDDKSLLVERNESNVNQDLYLVDVDSGKATPLTPHKGNEQYHSARFSHDGKYVYCVSTAGGRDLAAVARIEVATKKLTWVATPRHEVDSVLPSPKGRWLAWLVNEGGRSSLALRDPAGGPNLDVALPLGVASDLIFSPDESKLAMSFNGPRHNGDVWVIDLPRGEGKDRRAPRQLTHSSRAGIPFARLVEPELISYKTFDGKTIPAWWYPPVGQRKGLPPAVVYPHGGPESQTRAAFNYVFQYLCQAGYGVLAPNVRGSSGYGTQYMDLDNTTKRMDSVADLAHAAYWLRDEKKADPKRLAVYGGSYGGFMVLAAVTNYPDLFAAGIDVVGICNFVTFLEKTGAYRRAHREAEYGNLRDHRVFLERISPLRQADKIKCPMMVIHGANDPRVPIDEAEQIVAALRKREVPVTYLRYEDEGHGLAKLRNRLDAFPKMVAFLDRYLK